MSIVNKNKKVVVIADTWSADWHEFVETRRHAAFNDESKYLPYELKLGNRYLDVIDLANYAMKTSETSELSDFLIDRDQQGSLSGYAIYDFLTDQGYEVEYIRNFSTHKDQIRSLLEEEPLAVALSTSHLNVVTLQPLLSFLQKYRKPGTIIALGGYCIYSIANSPPEYVEFISDTASDLFLLTDICGLENFVQLLEGYENGSSDHSSVPNLIYIDSDGNAVRTDTTPPTCDLNDHVIHWDRMPEKMPSRVAPCRIFEGCPYRCEFCIFWKKFPKLRFLKEEHLTSELIGISKRPEVGHILLTDEAPNAVKGRFESFCKTLIDNQIELGWSSYLKSTPLTEETVKLMAASGCKMVSVGFESFNDHMLKAMNKKATVKDHLRCIEMLKKAGISIMGTFVVGFPGETKESVQRTVDVINESEIDVVELYSFTYFPEAPIEKQARELGLKGTTHHWSHKTMTSKQLFDEILPSAATQINNLGVVDWDNWASLANLLSHGYEFDTIKKMFGVRRRLVRMQEKMGWLDELDTPPQGLEDELNQMRKIVTKRKKPWPPVVT